MNEVTRKALEKLIANQKCTWDAAERRREQLAEQKRLLTDSLTEADAQLASCQATKDEADTIIKELTVLLHIKEVGQERALAVLNDILDEETESEKEEEAPLPKKTKAAGMLPFHTAFQQLERFCGLSAPPKIVMVAGTPKSGKSKLIERLSKFAEAGGVSTRIYAPPKPAASTSELHACAEALLEGRDYTSSRPKIVFTELHLTANESGMLLSMKSRWPLHVADAVLVISQGNDLVKIRGSAPNGNTEGQTWFFNAYELFEKERK